MANQQSRYDLVIEILKLLGLEEEKGIISLQLNIDPDKAPTVIVNKLVFGNGKIETKRFKFVEEPDDESNNTPSD